MSAESLGFAQLSSRDLLTWADEQSFGGIGVSLQTEPKTPTHVFIAREAIQAVLAEARD